MAKFLAEPELTWQGLITVEAVRLGVVKHEVEAQIENKERMREKEAAELGGEGESFTNADQEGFDVS
jgi:hypothetical protein